MLVNREIEVGRNAASLDKAPMSLGERIEARRKEVGLSQAELARRVGIRQSTMNSLIKGNSRTTRSIVELARELDTTPDYLMGRTDDPHRDAPPTPVVARVQLVMMPVSLPSEDVLAEMYEGQLRAFGRLHGTELARALAKRLPKALSRLQSAGPFHQSDDSAAALGSSEDLATDRLVQRQAQRT